MPPQFDALIYAASIWVIPLIIAITFHEAAHGYVARFFGDNTAWQFGRVTLNLLPLPPLDGGRIAVGLLPDRLAIPLTRLEPYGLAILIGLIFILPILGAQLGINLSIVSRLVSSTTYAVIKVILSLTGNT